MALNKFEKQRLEIVLTALSRLTAADGPAVERRSVPRGKPAPAAGGGGDIDPESDGPTMSTKDVKWSVPAEAVKMADNAVKSIDRVEAILMEVKVAMAPYAKHKPKMPVAASMLKAVTEAESEKILEDVYPKLVQAKKEVENITAIVKKLAGF